MYFQSRRDSRKVRCKGFTLWSLATEFMFNARKITISTYLSLKISNDGKSLLHCSLSFINKFYYSKIFGTFIEILYSNFLC